VVAAGCSVPFGETRVFRAGQTYEVGESYAYLWKDLQFAAWFEWQGEPIEVPPSMRGKFPHRPERSESRERG
jgi:hypothetical protein